MPYYSVPNGEGGWVPFSERVAMLHDPHQAKLAAELFLTDKYLPAKCLKVAFDKNSELSDWRATLIAKQPAARGCTCRPAQCSQS